jgi:hypothetical protein
MHEGTRPGFRAPSGSLGARPPPAGDDHFEPGLLRSLTPPTLLLPSEHSLPVPARFVWEVVSVLTA